MADQLSKEDIETIDGFLYFLDDRLKFALTIRDTYAEIWGTNPYTQRSFSKPTTSGKNWGQNKNNYNRDRDFNYSDKRKRNPDEKKFDGGKKKAPGR